MHVLTYAAVSKSYGTAERPALDRVSFTVAGGERVAVLGPNGSGKSTLLGLLTSPWRRFSGAVTVAGIDARRARARIGAVAQRDWLSPFETVEHTLRLHAALYRVPFDPRQNPSVAGILAALDLGPWLRHRIAQLSGGTRRRVSLAMALLHQPAVLALDEPTTGLDPELRADLWRVIRAASEGGTAVLFSTHLLDDADDHADRVLVLDAGRIVGDGAPALLAEDLGAGVLTVDYGRDMVEPRWSEIVRAAAPLALFFADRRRAKLAAPAGWDVARERERVFAVVERSVRAEATLSWRRPSLEDAYLRLLVGGPPEPPPSAQRAHAAA